MSEARDKNGLTAGQGYYRDRVKARTVGLNGLTPDTNCLTLAEYRRDVTALCDHIDEQAKEIENLREVLREADSKLSLLRHRADIQWGGPLPKAWEVDQTIGRIRRAYES